MRDLPHVGLYRRGTAAALLAASVLFLVDNLLHPEELARGNELEQVRIIADGYTSWQLAHALGLATVIGFMGVVLGLAFLVRRRRPGLGLWAGGLALAGLAGFAAGLAIDGYTWAVVGRSAVDPAVGERAAAAVLERVQGSGWSLVYYLTPAAFLVGFGVLAVTAARERAIPMWAGGLLALGSLMVAVETSVPSNAFFVASALVMLAGSAGAALALLRMTDAEFAAGGPHPG